MLEGKVCPELIIIDSLPKKAASTYNHDENLDTIDFDLGDLSDIDFSVLGDLSSIEMDFDFDDPELEDSE